MPSHYPQKAPSEGPNSLPLRALTAIAKPLVSYLLPSELHFNGSRRTGSWPNNPLLPLLMVFPSLRDPLYRALCETCYLHFSYYTHQRRTTYAGTAANEFFQAIGYERLQAVACLCIDISVQKPSRIGHEQRDNILSFLEVLTEHLSPTRYLEDLRLHFEPSPFLPPIIFRRGRLFRTTLDYAGCATSSLSTGLRKSLYAPVARRHPQLREENLYYVLVGLGTQPLIIFAFPRRQSLASPSIVQRTDLRALNSLIASAAKEKTIVSLDKLPPELRLMIYKLSMPQKLEKYSVERRRSPGFPNWRRSVFGDGAMTKLLLVSKEMNYELSRILYGKCCFEFKVGYKTHFDKTRYQESFLDEIGPGNAAMIRHIKLEINLQLYGVSPYYSTVVPALQFFINLLNTKCMTEADIEYLDQGVKEVIDAFSYLFRFTCTVAGRGKRVDLTVHVTAPSTAPPPAFFTGQPSPVRIVRDVLCASLRGYQSCIKNGEVIVSK